MEVRTDRFLATLGKQARRQLGNVLQPLHLPSRREIRQLSWRIDQLERRLDADAHRTASATRTAARRGAAPKSRTLALNSLQYAELFWDEV